MNRGKSRYCKDQNPTNTSNTKAWGSVLEKRLGVLGTPEAGSGVWAQLDRVAPTAFKLRGAPGFQATALGTIYVSRDSASSHLGEA